MPSYTRYENILEALISIVPWVIIFISNSFIFILPPPYAIGLIFLPYPKSWWVGIYAQYITKEQCKQAISRFVLFCIGLVQNLYDIQSPIQFRLNYTLIQEDPPPVYEGQSLPDISRYPILNQTQAIKDFEATFLKDCGEDKECQSDLNIQASLLNLPKG